MKTIYKILVLLLLGKGLLFAVSWEDCIDRYNKAKEFKDNIHLSYNYLKSTKQCLEKFKDILLLHPNSEFTIDAMNKNIDIINESINKLLPNYNTSKNSLSSVPQYLQTTTNTLVVNQEYNYFKKFNNCNGIHAGNKIYTAKHCGINNSKNIRNDLSYINIDTVSNLEIEKLDINKLGTFAYYSMSKEGMFFNILLKESKCKFYKVINIPSGINKTLDLADLNKASEIRSSCLAIPSNSGGGVFQENKLVAIISKTVFEKNKFLYSIIEPIIEE